MSDKPTMALPAAREFARHGRFELHEDMFQPDYLLPSTKARCFDEREYRTGGDLPPVSIPGGGLGVVITALTAIHKLETRCARPLGIRPADVVGEMELLFGLPSYHTDTTHRDESVKCAGCGHCMGAFDRQGLSDEAKHYLLDEYIPTLGARGAESVTYDGEHDASAVFVIKQFEFGIAPRMGQTVVSSAFVLAQAWHKRLVRRVANQLYFKITRKVAREVGFIPFVDDIVWASAKYQLGQTVKRLAETLPIYYVTNDPQGEMVITPMGEK